MPSRPSQAGDVPQSTIPLSAHGVPTREDPRRRAFLSHAEAAPTQDRCDGTSHIGPSHRWLVTTGSGKTYYLHMAGIRQNQQRNTFAFKHLLDESDTTDADQKLTNRLAHRRNKGLNPKPVGPGIMGRTAKYGKIKPSANTAIDLSLIQLRTALVAVTRTLARANWTNDETEVTVRFPVSCVKTVDTAGHITTSSTITISASRASPHIFEVYHCSG